VLYLYVVLIIISLVLRTVCAVTVCLLYKDSRRSSEVPELVGAAAGFRTLRRAEREINS
jgi:formylglycine-generating enzyme required for sulfatase activity